MDYLQFAILGLGSGAIIAAIGLGVVLSYRGSGVINFAHGAVAMYVAYLFAGLRQSGEYFLPIPGLPARVHLAGSVGFVPALILSLSTAVILGFLLHHLVFRPLHLWIYSIKTGKATKMSARPLPDDRKMFGQIGMVSVAWFGNQIILSLKQADSANLWAATVTPGTHELAGELTRLTLGSGDESMPSVSATK